MTVFTAKQINRFWSKVDRKTNTDCWPWTASTNGAYGQVVINYQRYGAHRVAYELSYGMINDGLFVCHRCDNSICCNPDHLFLGTHQENMKDAQRKGRLGKLSMGDVAIIRERYATGQEFLRQIAADFNISESAVSLIVNNKRWYE